jgi:hypothetical protein
MKNKIITTELVDEVVAKLKEGIEGETATAKILDVMMLCGKLRELPDAE